MIVSFFVSFLETDSTRKWRKKRVAGHDFWQLVLLLRTAFDRLLASNAQRANEIASLLAQKRYPMFRRLYLYAANKCGATQDLQALKVLTERDGWCLWASDTTREVNVYLRERVKNWNSSEISELCKVILHGPTRQDYHTMPDDEWRELQDRMIVKRLCKLEQGGVPLPPNIFNKIAELNDQYQYSLPSDQRDEFLMYSEGVRSVSWDDDLVATDYSSFAELEPAERVLNWASEQSGMMRKLATENPSAVLETLDEALAQEKADDEMWSAAIRGLASALDMAKQNENPGMKGD